MAPGDLLSQAVAEVPFDEKEAELLSGGVPRGYKALTTATAKLVKAGWLVKGRSGWTATEEGARAVAAFPDADSFANAMVSGAPVPDAPAAPAEHAPQAPEQLGEEAQAGSAEDPTPPDVTPTLDVDVDSAAPSPTDVAPEDAEPIGESWQDQPQSGTPAGDLDPLFGEDGHWTTHLRELQLTYDANDNVWAQTLQLPAGNYQFKIVVNGSWDENYGRFGVRNGDNHELHLLSDTAVTIRFDYGTTDIVIS
ncbi:pullulanase X25 domain-containing protein [Arthrobacter sp. RIT-PI-e]|uniref:pullulanase X25 domain-containing protein n=1 Tax=Arthrobacter sp. RIT-PI-e TaxID=1681197 RepID=UPI0006760B62|nr:hypothetical protein [Arthrobacter sp. RIT-PI-e]